MTCMKYRVVVFLTLLSTTLSACGSSPTKHLAVRPSSGVSVRFCSGLTDKCVSGPLRLTLMVGSARGRIPDVSSFQGHPNWAAAKAAGIAGGIFKGGEYVTDPTAYYNATHLVALHLWHAMYWFVRNTGCSHEAAQIIATAHWLHVLVVINDLEVREAAGYGACLVPAERAARLIPVDYTGPGTWPGGGFGLAPLWQAEYGPILHSFWSPVVAWQCTDGVFGCVTFVPGIGTDDVSINLGITKLGVPAPKPVPKPPTFAQQYDQGWNRGYTVHWDRRHQRAVPPLGHPQSWFTKARQVGYDAGYRRVR